MKTSLTQFYWMSLCLFQITLAEGSFIDFQFQPADIRDCSESQLEDLVTQRAQEICAGLSTTGAMVPEKIERQFIESYVSDGCHLPERTLKIGVLCKPSRSPDIKRTSSKTAIGFPQDSASIEHFRRKYQKLKEFYPSGLYDPSGYYSGLEPSDIPPMESLAQTDLEIAELREKLTSVLSKVDEYNKYYPNEIERLEILSKKGEGLTPEDLRTIVSAKKEWVEILHQEGSIFDLATFKSNHPGISALQRFLKLQSPQIDLSIDEDLIESYLAEQIYGRPFKVLIAGAGPIGALLGLKEFAAGADVHITDMRSEVYSRGLGISVRRNILAQLNYLLGSKFDSAFQQPPAYLKCNGHYEIGRIPLNRLEDILKIRLTELLSRAQTRIPHHSLQYPFQYPLQLDYLLKFDSLLFESHSVGDPVHIKPYLLGMESKSENAQFRPPNGGASSYNRRDEKQLSKSYNMIVFASGSNDSTREKYLAPAVKQTRTVYLMHAVWYKNDDIAGINPFKIEHLPHSTLQLQELFDAESDSLWERILTTLPELVTHSSDFDQFNRQFLKFKTSDAAIQTLSMNDLNREATMDLLFPTDFGNWLENLNELLNKYDLKKQAPNLTTFLLEKAMTKAFHFFVKKPIPLGLTPLKEYGLIPVVIKGPRKRVKEFRSTESEVILTVAGDANISADFRMGTGLVVGELSILDIVDATKSFMRYGKTNWIDLDQRLALRQDLALKFATFREPLGSQKFLTENEFIENTLNASIRLLERYKTDQRTERRGYRVESMNRLTYQLFSIVDGIQTTLGTIEITQSGEFEFTHTKSRKVHRYDNIEELFFDLEFATSFI